MPEKPVDFDVIIIGGGPGGLSAGLWCADLGLKAVVLEKEMELGGQLLWTFNDIENYLGTQRISGPELRDTFQQHIVDKEVKRLTGASVSEVDLVKKRVTLADDTRLSGKAIIIATGVRRRKLEVPGEEEFAGRGMLDSGVKNRDEVTDKTVVIVGGGDAALENALILGENAKEIIVIHRRGEFSARTEFIDLAKKRDNVNFLLNKTVREIIGNAMVEAIELRDTISGERSTVAAGAVLIRIGVVPNSELFCGQISLDAMGYIETDDECKTNVTGVYAVGDVASPHSPTILNAAGQGSAAAKSVSGNAHDLKSVICR